MPTVCHWLNSGEFWFADRGYFGLATEFQLPNQEHRQRSHPFRDDGGCFGVDTDIDREIEIRDRD